MERRVNLSVLEPNVVLSKVEINIARNRGLAGIKETAEHKQLAEQLS